MTSRRSVRYPGPDAPLVVPLEAWARTLQTIRTFGDENSEALVFWGGVVVADSLQVTAVYMPVHKPQGWRVRLTDVESRWLVRRLAERDEKLVAQVHSHPELAFHSPGDEARAASFHAGYMSIVVPRFGSGVEDLAECAVFEFDGARFIAVAPGEVERRVRLLPMIEERRQGTR